jgi:pimeloyl-ACP methyl ester carboxylesterase
MIKEKLNGRSVFLNFGPGGRAAVERQLFTDENIFFHEINESTFAEASNTLLQLCRDSQNIRFITNSYGAYFLLRNLQNIKTQINKIIILGSQPNLSRTYGNLVNYFVDNSIYPNELKEKYDHFLIKQDLDSFMVFAEEFMKKPDFMINYWGDKNSKNYKIWGKEFLSGSLLDMDVYNSLIVEHIKDKTFFVSPSLIENDIEVTLFRGNKDPFRGKDDIELWEKYFPNLSFQEVDSGHFIHLERPVSEWNR